MANDREIRDVGAQVSAGVQGAPVIVDIDYVSFDGIRYEGKLYFKLPSVAQTLKMGAFMAAYIQGQFPSGKIDALLVPEMIRDLAEAVASIEMLMALGPEWAVKIQECPDADLPIHVMQRYRYERRQFRNAGTKPAAGNSSAATGANPALVPPSVPTAAE